MKRLARIVLPVILGLATLTACEDDGRKCLEWETVTGTTVVFTGKTTVPVVTTTNVCTRYATEEADAR